MATSLVIRTTTETMTGIMISPERVITNMVQIDLADALHEVKTPTASAAAMASVNDHVGMRVPLTAIK